MDMQLSGHFSYRKLITYVLPCIAMMVITSVYSIVDGFFVSNIVGKNAFAAVNLIMPVLMGIAAFGFMIGTGGSALTAYYMGQQEQKKANAIFSMLIELILIGSVIAAALGFIFMPQIVNLLGASDVIRSDAILYGRILILAEPFFMLQNSFQSFLTTAGKQRMGFCISVCAGVTNAVMDYVLIALCGFGIPGAAFASLLGQVIGGLVPLIYFLRGGSGNLKLVRSAFDFRLILKACSNGASEMMTNLSGSLVSILYNYQLMRFAAEDGISAYGVVMYVCFIFLAIFLGYAIGINPIIGYHYGAGNKDELHSIWKKSLILISITAVMMTALSELLALPIVRIFVGYDEALCQMTQKAFMMYSVSYLISGFNIFGSGFFTGLNNGLISALISGLRSLVFEMLSVLLLPVFFGINGIWSAVTVAELLTLCVTIHFFRWGRKTYGY